MPQTAAQQSKPPAQTDTLPQASLPPQEPTTEESDPAHEKDNGLTLLYVVVGIVSIILLSALAVVVYTTFVQDNVAYGIDPESETTEDEIPSSSSNSIDSWETLSSDTTDAELDAYTTEDWETFTPSDKKPPFQFTLKYPPEWNTEVSRLYYARNSHNIDFMENEIKTAGFRPPGIITTDTENCFHRRSEEYEPTMGAVAKETKRESFSIDGVSGTLSISELHTQDGSIFGYSLQYCIDTGKGYIVLEFLPDTLESANIDLYETMVSTFSIKK